MGAKGISKSYPIGKRFGRITVVGIPQTVKRASAVPGRCDCGDERVYFTGNLRVQAEPMCPTCRIASRPAKGNSRRHPLFNIWKAMIQRCENPKHTFFGEYGGRGISICRRWRDDFTAFVADVGSRPAGTTLDRIDNDKGYEPGNTRWATQREQMNNRRANVRIDWRGQSLTIAQAAETAGLETATLAFRMKAGWDIDRAMTTPSLMTKNKGVPKPKREPVHA